MYSTVNTFDYSASYWVQTKPGLGAQLVRLSDHERKARQTKSGARVGMVIYDRPAEKADLMGDDIVESIDGKRLAGIYNLDEWVYVSG